MSAINIRNLSVYYDAECALKDINLKVKSKDFLGIIGPNGGGKTTLLKVLLKLIKPSSGVVEINEHGPIGYVPQHTSFDRTFPINVNEVILMGRLNKGSKWFHRYSQHDRKKADKIMQQLSLSAFSHKQIGKLSGGQLQKVLIARALMTNPNILILDEPTANIDKTTKLEIYEILRDLNKDMTILLVTHDMEDVFPYLDSVLCVNKTAHYIDNKSVSNEKVLEETYGCPVKIFSESTLKHQHLVDNKEDIHDSGNI